MKSVNRPKTEELLNAVHLLNKGLLHCLMSKEELGQLMKLEGLYSKEARRKWDRIYFNARIRILEKMSRVGVDAVLKSARPPDNEAQYDQARKVARRISMPMMDRPNLIFHGTRFTKKIIGADTLLRYPSGAISFTRSLYVAVHWALLPRHGGDERGAVLAFNRNALRKHYDVVHWRDDFWDNVPNYPHANCDEAEERIQGQDVVSVSKYLHSIVSVPPQSAKSACAQA